MCDVVGPIYDITLEREVKTAEINHQYYDNVVVRLKSADEGLFVDKSVKVVVFNKITGKKIYKKRFKSYLYAFSDGQILVGHGIALPFLIIYKEKETWYMKLREGGIY